MKLSVATVVLAAALAEAHYTFPSIDNTPNWQYVRMTTNYQSNRPVLDVNSEEIRCYERFPGTGAPGIYNVTAGQTIVYNAKSSVSHPGPMAFYIAKVPAGQTAASWDGKSSVWSKIYQEMPTFSSTGPSMIWSSSGATALPVTIPACLQDGDYLLRAEHIALHAARYPGDAQFYISCAQLTVSGGSGTWSPKNTVAFPGAYKDGEPGLIHIYYPRPTSYTPVGPPVEQC
ncbi:lytic polysaccharide monooxygenase [Parathielavia hyrcaniae]|uniref:lytic cellulose monooxygenase (C4-dehydrogenating) n=1 Tax=Parathielavia hyrcaniae TaxID=113614 RepID=A0AAN6QAM1_9PEZI|nr:lytic polysaccharide monooxygenase [Parathielavia hyrcaniae]